MKSIKIVGVLTGVLMMVAVLTYGANIPQMINYQGTLKQNGTPANGPVNMVFSVYSTATGSNPLWTENWSSTAAPPNPVIVTNGNFNVMLGALSPFPSTFFADHQKTYLGIKVGADSEMLPRQQFASVGYSFAAGNGIPKGGIIMWSGAVNQIPDGWALCDGQNGTPDLRDRFITGAGSTYTIGATGGETAHVLTVSEMPLHSHGVNDPGHRHTLITNGGTTSSGNFANVSGGNPDQYTQYATTGITIQNAGGGQAHNILPPYYALAFIMKL